VADSTGANSKVTAAEEEEEEEEGKKNIS